MEIYTVQKGDTVPLIAGRFGVSPDRIISDNAIPRSGALAEGQALLILRPKTVYTFKRGDTLYSVSKAYDTTVMQLLRNNPSLIGREHIPEGTRITVAFDDTPTRSIRTSGFAYDFINRHVLEFALPYLTYMIVFGYGFREDGSIIEPDDSDIIDLAHRYGTAVFLGLTTINADGTFGGAKSERLFTDPDFQNTVIKNMEEVILRKNAQGMDIDMEFIPPRFRNEFAAFVDNATQRLNSAGLETHTDLAPKVSPYQQGTLYEAHDYRLLGEASDLIFLMTYEWGYTYSEPRAVAPLPNVKRVLDYALTEIPAGKLFLGIPNYGYDWKLPYEKGITKAETIGNLTAVDLAVSHGSAILFDETAQTPYFRYTENGEEHEVWFEDVRSIGAKLGLAGESGIAGCGYWNLMRPFPQNFLLLNSFFDIKKVYNNL